MPRNTSGLLRGGGRRKGIPNKITRDFKALLAEKFGDDGRVLIDRLEVLSRHRNPKVKLAAIELLLAYLLGKPTQRLEHAGDASNPVRVSFGGRYRPDEATT